ncbi:MAG: hypothetical protein H7318_14020 [Oligoflexus sp.]|nr:hypothetical protein [Oligoflexus sp.]
MTSIKALLLLLCLQLSPSLFAQTAGVKEAVKPLTLCFGDDISQSVVLSISDLIAKVAVFDSHCADPILDQKPRQYLVFGNHSLAQKAGLVQKAQNLSEESLLIDHREEAAKSYIFALGKARAHERFNLGSHYAAYEVLETLGFRFLHPLEPYVPSELQFKPVTKSSSPHWPIRRWHLHTQHPLELTNLLNGWGETPEDEQGFQSMLSEWDRVLEWCLANKQNEISWYLLRAEAWKDFADSPTRQARLKQLVNRAQDFGLKAGLVAPLAFRQQHAWTMIRHEGDETLQIEKAIDWLAGTDVDFIETEMGFSEFTHPDDRTMLSWMNQATRYAKDVYGIETSVKVHASTGQKATHFVDPETEKSLNFNFLPYYADPDLAVMPHTVQFYGLKDPAPTYGNRDFSEIYRYLHWEAGRRKVLFYPETAYWVSFDIDVPLFLPIYAERRLSDLRLLAFAETAGELGMGTKIGSRINGQVNFSSGWEWGYWLNDVIASRAAWDPLLNKTDAEALDQALQPFSSLFAEQEADVRKLLIDTIQMEKRLLMLGELAGKRPVNPEKRTGQAYLQGFDAWDDIANLLSKGSTQPAKLGLIAMRNPLTPIQSGQPSFEREISPLLIAMNQELLQLANRSTALLRMLPLEKRSLFTEIDDALRITSLRARQVFALYHFVNEDKKGIFSKKKDFYRDLARSSLDEAKIVSARRSTHYRVPLARIAAWKEGPTAYPYGYLWTADTLAYWWRDEAKAHLTKELPKRFLSPCFLNLVDPINVALGQDHASATIPSFDKWTVAGLETFLARILGPSNATEECLNKPASEPLFPLDGLRVSKDE